MDDTNSIRRFSTTSIRSGLFKERATLHFHQVVQTLLIVRHWLWRVQTGRRGDEDDRNVDRVFSSVTDLKDDDKVKKKWWRKIWEWSYEETSTFFYIWTFIVVMGCLYNLITVVVMVFEEVHRFNYSKWITLNLIFDTVFLLDIFVMTRREFLDGGVRVSSPLKMLKHRIQQKHFILDVICVFPSDLLLFLKKDFSLSRLNRFLKCYRIGEFNALTEIRTAFPNLFRVLKLIVTCFIIFHCNGCLYFFIGVIYDFNKAVLDDWIFSYDKIPNPVIVTCDIFDPMSLDYCSTDKIESPREFADFQNISHYIHVSNNYWDSRSEPLRFSNFTKQYGLSFYWSALTLVTLGEQPWPNTTFQNSFEIADTLLGLVIFAVIVGDVGNMVTNMNLKKTDFNDILDGCKRYMIQKKVPTMLQRKAVHYFGHLWETGAAQVDESEIAQFLPPRLYGQLAVHIHMQTLLGVKLFENCEPNLLYELILKLEPRYYSPMDYICKKGEVGTEMYIVKSGFVEVVSEDGTKVFVRLGEGTVFGELSILNIPGNKNGNRRTASVRSVGYSDLYTLSKDSLWEALSHYPDAKISLLNKGKEILAKDGLLEERKNFIEEGLDGLLLEQQLESIAQLLKKIDDDLSQAESRFQDNSTKWKNRVFKMEQELSCDIKSLKGSISGKSLQIDQ